MSPLIRLPKTYDVARPAMKSAIKRFPILARLPIFRQYAKGGKFYEKKQTPEAKPCPR